MAFFVGHDIDAGYAAAVAQMEDIQGQVLHFFGQFRRNRSRAEMLGDARGILGIEVVLARAGHDADDREGDVVHDGDGEFIAIDEGFGYQRSAVLEGFFQGRTEFLLGLDNDRADTRSLTGRLDDDRQVEALFNVGSDGFAVLSGEIVGKGRCGNAGPLKAALLMTLFMPTALAMTPGPV